jgi:hypothetical protein
MKTAVEWLFNQIPDHLRLTQSGFEMLQQAKEMENQMLIDLVEQLKNYTQEAKCILGDDERDASEFVEIFKQEK